MQEIEINLKPVFDYLDDFKKEVNGRFDNLEEKVDVLQTSVDSLAKQNQDLQQEHIILNCRVEVIEEKVG